MERSYHLVAKGLCRPPMFLMAPFDAVVFNVMLSVIVCLAVGEMALLPVCLVPLHAIAVLVSLVEPRAFELVHRCLAAAGLARPSRLMRGMSLAAGRVRSDGLR